jgi:hypothetical protein
MSKIEKQFSKSLLSEGLVPPGLAELVEFGIELLVKPHVVPVYLGDVKFEIET